MPITTMTIVLRLPIEPAICRSPYLRADLLPAHMDDPVPVGGCSVEDLTVLPAKEIVVIVPAAGMSWHRVQLPSYVAKGSARMEQILQSLLEPEVLEDAVSLHMALPSDWKPHTKVWVGVCRKNWLREHLQLIVEHGVRIRRIIPEIAPSQDEVVRVHILEGVHCGEVWFSSRSGGVWGGGKLHEIPPLEQLAKWTVPSNPGFTVESVPALMPHAAKVFGDRVCSASLSQHWRKALDTSWSLAQFEMKQFTAKGFGAAIDALSKRVLWWGFSVLVVMQLIGLNIWSWRTQERWRMQESQISTLVRDTFPHLSVLLDPVKQMERAVEELARQHPHQDHKGVLALLSVFRSSDATRPSSVERLELRGNTLEIETSNARDLSEWADQLNPQEWNWRIEGSKLTIERRPHESGQ